MSPIESVTICQIEFIMSKIFCMVEMAKVKYLKLRKSSWVLKGCPLRLRIFLVLFEFVNSCNFVIYQTEISQWSDKIWPITEGMTPLEIQCQNLDFVVSEDTFVHIKRPPWVINAIKCHKWPKLLWKVWDSNSWPLPNPFFHSKSAIFMFKFHIEHKGAQWWDLL